jgi:hypothetical protein
MPGQWWPDGIASTLMKSRSTLPVENSSTGMPAE